MSAPRVLVGGRPLPLDRLIGKGGEGVVYLVAGDHTQAVKLYTTSDRLSREDKIAAMVKHRLADQTLLVAFPFAMVHLGDGTFAGFVMKMVPNHRPIHELYAPGSRKQHFPQADYRFLARSASNIAKAFASVHQTGCVVGDINHSGVLVSAQATAALIDADSFQFTADGQQYLCKVGVPEYTPPELQGKPLSGIVRTPDHDAFGLAVVIFQVLLMGRHPFVGTVRKGEIPPLDENIRNFKYVYAEDRNVGMDQPPGTPGLTDFSPELAGLFNRAFSKAGVGKRPTAKEWVSALERFESSLVQCPDNSLHYGPKDASECAWCEMEKSLHTILFQPYYGGSAGLSGAGAANAANFDIRVIAVRIGRVQVPQPQEVQPTVNKQSPDASERARAAESSRGGGGSVVGTLLLVFAVVAFIAAPKAWLLAAGLAWWGFSKIRETGKKAIDGSPFHDEYVKARHQWFQEQENWRRRMGLPEILDLKRRLTEAKDRYEGLEGDERRQIQEYRTRRRELQLRAYLEGFDLARSNIKGVGMSKMAALASYGIDTAADVTSSKLAAVPGFGDALIGRMLEWRQYHEARFVYSPTENETDRREIARIRGQTESKAAPLRSTLSSGVAELEARFIWFQEVIRKVDPVLQTVADRIEQAQKDLEFLKLHVPQVNPPSPPRPAPAPSMRAPTPQYGRGQPGTAPSQAPRPTGTGMPSCPRCGSSMRQRQARRGRNAGNYFWGCSRFPSCKGTRNI